jgi:hypothetical protein
MYCGEGKLNFKVRETPKENNPFGGLRGAQHHAAEKARTQHSTAPWRLLPFGFDSSF